MRNKKIKMATLKERYDDFNTIMDMLSKIKSPQQLYRIIRKNRNPLIFDNNIKNLYYKIKYFVVSEYDGDYTYDHLIGMVNIVRFMFENKLYGSVFKDECEWAKVFKTLNVQISVPKKLNNKDSYRYWKFDDCIRWDNKLKEHNIHWAEDKNGNKISVDEIYKIWYKDYEEIVLPLISVAKKEIFEKSEQINKPTHIHISIKEKNFVQIYKRKIDEWKENQKRLNKSNFKPGQGTRSRIQREALEECNINN